MDDGQQIIKLIQNPTFIILMTWGVRELWRLYQKNNKAYDKAIEAIRQNQTSAITENTNKMSELTISMVRLETKLEAVERSLSVIPGIEKDINALHSKVRFFEAKTAQ